MVEGWHDWCFEEFCGDEISKEMGIQTEYPVLSISGRDGEYKLYMIIRNFLSALSELAPQLGCLDDQHLLGRHLMSSARIIDPKFETHTGDGRLTRFDKI